MTVPEVHQRSWQEMSRDEFFEIAQLRNAVFALEQRVTAQDFDETDRDASTTHLWIADALGCAAYVRTYPLGTPELGGTRSFGRMAVRADRRGDGLARQLVDAVLERFGDEPMTIHSQAQVTGLYRCFGFHPVGGTTVEAGIPHQMMTRPACGM